jgi:hypothetical protein
MLPEGKKQPSMSSFIIVFTKINWGVMPEGHSKIGAA